MGARGYLQRTMWDSEPIRSDAGRSSRIVPRWRGVWGAAAGTESIRAGLGQSGRQVARSRALSGKTSLFEGRAPRGFVLS